MQNPDGSIHAAVAPDYSGNEIAGAGQPGYLRARGKVVYLVRRAYLEQPSVHHHPYPVGHRECLLAVVGYENGRHSMGAQDGLDFRPEPLPHRGVQVAERLIQKRGGGIRSQCPRQGNPLLLTAGEFIRVSASISGQTHQFQDFRHPFGATRVVEVAGGRRLYCAPPSCGGTARIPARPFPGRACPAERSTSRFPVCGQNRTLASRIRQ